MSLSRFLVFAISATIVGCKKTERISIELYPRGAEVLRALSTSPSIPSSMGSQLAHYYPAGVTARGRRASWFKGEMPDDVGNSGFYEYFPSEAGDAFFYVERFRGRSQSKIPPDVETIDEKIAQLELNAFRIVSPDLSSLQEDAEPLYGFSKASLKAQTLLHNLGNWRSKVRTVLFMAEADDVEARQTLEAAINDLGIDRDLLHEKRVQLDGIRNAMRSLLVQRAEVLAGAGNLMDPWASIEAIDEGVDWLIDDLLKWWHFELSASPRWPQVEALLDHALRRDLKTLALVSLLQGPYKEMSPNVAMLLLSLQERGVPFRRLVQLKEEFGFRSEEENYRGLLKLLESYFETPLGFMDPDRIEMSLGLYKAWKEARLEALEALPGIWYYLFEDKGLLSEMPLSFRFFWGVFPEFIASAARHTDSMSITEDGGPLDYVASGFLSASFSSTTLKVRLALPQAPLWTNGLYDSSQGAVLWPREEISDNDLFPRILTCTWVVPDGSWQTEHLGTPDALRGEDLLAYATWRSCLQPGEAEAWSAFVSGLSPDEAGVDSLRAFSFSGWDEKGERIRGVNLLLKAITGEGED